jgi:urease accessory protein
MAEMQDGRIAGLRLLHLCDSLFPIGSFAYSDGLEVAAVRPMARPSPGATEGGAATAGESETATAHQQLRAWMDACVDETFGRMEAPTLWRAWAAFRGRDWQTLTKLDAELTALRPSSSARRSSRAMGRRLLTTWHALHPHPALDHALTLVRAAALGPTLPIAFAGACACAGVDRRHSVEAFAYTRLAATASAAMRVMTIGQTDAHLLLARALDAVPAIVDAVVDRNGEAESFTPAMDIAIMTQQYLHSRLFRS